MRVSGSIFERPGLVLHGETEVRKPVGRTESATASHVCDLAASILCALPVSPGGDLFSLEDTPNLNLMPRTPVWFYELARVDPMIALRHE